MFRSFHTIKGAAGFLNLNDVTHVAHAVEDVLDSARKGKLKLTSSILDVALESIDLLKELIDAVKTQLAGGERAIQALGYPLGGPGERLPLAGHLGEPATAHLNQGKLGGDEEAVKQDQGECRHD